MPPDEEPVRAHDVSLATGELSERDAAELADLKQQIEEQAGFRCAGYKERCLRRRIAVRMRACAVHGYGDYRALLERDPDEYRKLVDAVTINVSKFFRNTEVWTLLAAEVIPRLVSLDAPRINIWSAGAAAGEEIYSVAILLLEHAERERFDLSRFRLVGTDIDLRTLDDARRGVYGAFALSETPRAMRERWFEGPDLTLVRKEVRDMVEFAELDLIADPYPTDQHLILCRNVVIYFERLVQEAVFRRFYNALVPGGHLLLGKVEALFGEPMRAFRTVVGRDRLFQKP
jgi:chemotaxis methyl-accepting protein methylase